MFVQHALAAVRFLRNPANMRAGVGLLHTVAITGFPSALYDQRAVGSARYIKSFLKGS
jgi:hypothetical protein